MLAAISINWQELLANYWPHILAVIGGLLGWNNREEIKAALAKTASVKPNADGVSPKWGADQVAPDGTIDFTMEIVSRMDGVPPALIVELLVTEGLTPDRASKAAVQYFREQVKS